MSDKSWYERPSYLCRYCGRTSHYYADVQNRYCGNCHQFEDDRLHCLLCPADNFVRLEELLNHYGTEHSVS